MEWLQHFKYQHTSGKRLLIVGGNKFFAVWRLWITAEGIISKCMDNRQRPHIYCKLLTELYTSYLLLSGSSTYVHDHPKESINKSIFERYVSVSYIKIARFGIILPGFQYATLKLPQIQPSLRRWIPSFHSLNEGRLRTCDQYLSNYGKTATVQSPYIVHSCA